MSTNTYRANEMIEIAFQGEEPQGSKVKVDVKAEITGPEGTKVIKGFYAGENTFKVRFLPETEGTYQYKVTGLVSGEGSMEVLPADEKHCGIVRAEGTHLVYKNGKAFYGFGTTVYALAHQSEELMDETMETLSHAPFNKVRMCLFPKHYNYNHNEPAHYAFSFKKGVENPVFDVNCNKGSETKAENLIWDVDCPCFTFWDAFEYRLNQLFEMGIQVDLILFHPYDRWGFSTMPREDNLTYLDYLLRRFAAYPNMWWSLCNEYDLCGAKNSEDWESFGTFLAENDPYHHLIGNHNCFAIYDASKPFITHASIQRRKVSRVEEFMKKWGKPVCMDECAYEGNLLESWGNISGMEMTRRFWITTVTGGHCTHGETYLDPKLAYSDDAIVWWARGGKLIGESPKRIAFLREIVESFPGPIEPMPSGLCAMLSRPREEIIEKKELVPADNKAFFDAILQMDDMERIRFADSEPEFAGHVGEDVLLYYNDEQCPARRFVNLPTGKSYKIEAIDTWNMTREVIAEGAKGEEPRGTYEVLMPAPARPYMALLCTAEKKSDF